MRKNGKPLPADASPDIVEKYHQLFISDARFSTGKETIDAVFAQFPCNTDTIAILAKACVLDSLYSTNVFNIYAVALHIKSLNIDARLGVADLSLVNEIATVKLNGVDSRNFYSFASKYCHFHNPAYPIYDSFVEDVLVHYQIKSPFMPLEAERKADIRKHLKNYKNFVAAIDSFKEKYGLHGIPNENIDHFLWGYGKEYYPKSYAKD
jgi:hypothetical protein